MMRRWLAGLALGFLAGPAAAAFLGHGGLVKGLALTADGETMASVSFDYSVIVRRRCVACHTLEIDGGNRAGPTLHGIFGRPIGAVAGYPYSDALADGDIVWTEAAVAELFRRGPEVVKPGSKMPIQRITDKAELAALIDFLGREAMPWE